MPQLEKQRIDLENDEIITLFRSSKVSPDDFADFIRMYKERITMNTPINLNQSHGDEIAVNQQ